MRSKGDVRHSADLHEAPEHLRGREQRLIFKQHSVILCKIPQLVGNIAHSGERRGQAQAPGSGPHSMSFPAALQVGRHSAAGAHADPGRRPPRHRCSTPRRPGVSPRAARSLQAPLCALVSPPRGRPSCMSAGIGATGGETHHVGGARREGRKEACAAVRMCSNGPALAALSQRMR